MMYIGSGYGILEFDPAFWQLLAITNPYLVILQNRNASGKLSEGAKGKIGYLEPERMGNLCYTALLNFTRQNDRNFNSARVKTQSSAPLLFIVLGFWLWESECPARTKVSRSDAPMQRIRALILSSSSSFALINGTGA